MIPVNEGGIESILRIKEVLDRREHASAFRATLRRRRRHGAGDLHGPQGPSRRTFVAEKSGAGGILLCDARTRQALPLHLRHSGGADGKTERRARKPSACPKPW